MFNRDPIDLGLRLEYATTIPPDVFNEIHKGVKSTVAGISEDARLRELAYAQQLIVLHDIRRVASQIDLTLARDFGGKGRTIKDKLNSLARPVPMNLECRLRYIVESHKAFTKEMQLDILPQINYLEECEALAMELVELADLRGYIPMADNLFFRALFSNPCPRKIRNSVIGMLACGLLTGSIALFIFS
jgi:hypothetical protein